MDRSTLISRRTALAGVGALAAAGLLPRTARAAEFEYKMGHSSPESHPFHKRLLEVAARFCVARRMRLGGAFQKPLNLMEVLRACEMHIRP